MIGINSPEFKVGALVIAVSSLIGGMSLKVSEGPGMLTVNHRHHFDIEDAGGLVRNGAVKMAGIKVGAIDKIKLVDDKARVIFVIDRNVPITTSSQISIRTDGILGDKYVEIIPGQLDDPILESGLPITQVVDQGAFDTLMKDVGQLVEVLTQVAKNLDMATRGGAGDNITPLGRIFINMETLTKDLSEISSENKGKIGDIVSRLQSLTARLDDLLDPEGIPSALGGLLENLKDVTGKINEGEGTIGRLVNDEKTIDGINEVIGGVNDFLGAAKSLETSIDFHTEHLTGAGLSKSFVSVRFTPGLDRYYEVGIVSDPRGVIETDVRRETPLEGPVTEVETVQTFKNKMKFTALFAKNFHNWTVKGGLIENSGGVGLDYHLFHKKLRLSVEAFNFEDVYLRSFVRYNFFKSVYLMGGGDHLLSSEGHDGAFFGAGIFLTNEDLKYFASKLSF